MRGEENKVVKYYMTTDHPKGSNSFTEELVYPQDLADAVVLAKAIVEKRQEHEDSMLLYVTEEINIRNTIKFERI